MEVRIKYANTFHCIKIFLNLPRNDNYDVHKPWVYNLNLITRGIDSDVTIVVINMRIFEPNREEFTKIIC